MGRLKQRALSEGQESDAVYSVSWEPCIDLPDRGGIPGLRSDRLQ